MASPDFNIGPTGPVTPPPPSRALTRVTPVVPQRVTTPEPDSPLSGSGLDVREIFRAPDQVVVRSRTPAIALELGLEHARGSMVRNQPADALAALDEIWSGARHTETGWYLRGGSLVLLGLPGEASRVVAEGLLANARSSANYFLQSLTQLALGETAAAQLSLANAADHSEPDALLLIQHALLSAESGDIYRAEELLRQAAVRWPDHPALAYGRDMMRQVLRNRARGNGRTPNTARTPVSVEALEHEELQEVVRTTSRARVSAVDNEESTRDASPDVLTEALSELGNQLRTGTKRQALTAARAMLGSLSAGGTMATSIPASRAHAARAVLGAILEALSTPSAATGFGWDAESVDGQWQRATPEWSATVDTNVTSLRGNEVLLNTVRVLVAALRDDRPAEAEQQLSRARGSVGETSLRLLRAIVGAAEPSTKEMFAAHQVDEQGSAYIRNGAPGHSLLAPLRLGLALLPESELSGRKIRAHSDADAAVTYAASIGATLPAGNGLDLRERAGSHGSLVAAVGLLAAAMLAFSASLPMIAIGCIGAGGWLVLRRGSRAP